MRWSMNLSLYQGFAKKKNKTAPPPPLPPAPQEEHCLFGGGQVDRGTGQGTRAAKHLPLGSLRDSFRMSVDL